MNVYEMNIYTYCIVLIIQKRFKNIALEKSHDLCINEMKRELYRTTKHKNDKHVVFFIA